MNNDLQAGIDTAAQAEEQAKAFAKLVRAGTMALSDFAPARQEAIRKYLAAPDPRHFFAQQSADRLKFFQALKANGHEFHHVSRADHAHIFGKLVHDVDAGIKTTVRQFLKDYGAASGYSPDWAEAVANKPQPKRTKASLAQYRDHPVFVDLKENSMLTQTHKAALQEATYAGISTMLFSGSQSARKHKELLARLDAAEARAVRAEAKAEFANARLDIKDAGLDWKEKARSILAIEPGISNRELARRVGKSHVAVGKYRGSWNDGSELVYTREPSSL